MSTYSICICICIQHRTFNTINYKYNWFNFLLYMVLTFFRIPTMWGEQNNTGNTLYWSLYFICWLIETVFIYWLIFLLLLERIKNCERLEHALCEAAPPVSNTSQAISWVCTVCHLSYILVNCETIILLYIWHQGILLWWMKNATRREWLTLTVNPCVYIYVLHS